VLCIPKETNCVTIFPFGYNKLGCFPLLRSGEVCRQRWNQIVRGIGGHREKPFIEQVEVLSRRYCPEMIEYRQPREWSPTLSKLYAPWQRGVICLISCMLASMCCRLKNVGFMRCAWFLTYQLALSKARCHLVFLYMAEWFMTCVLFTLLIYMLSVELDLGNAMFRSS
jgi:hypothetical protein